MANHKTARFYENRGKKGCNAMDSAVGIRCGRPCDPNFGLCPEHRGPPIPEKNPKKKSPPKK